MFEEITKWQRATFPKTTPYSAAKHLQEEVEELVNDITTLKSIPEKTKAEYADCFLLLFCSADHYGLSYEDICQLIKDKMKINKARKWGEPNQDGYVKHIK